MFTWNLDMSSSGDVNVKINVPIQEHISISSVQHLRVASLPPPMSNSTRSANRRNKRKNFQPRNIRSGGLADDEDDNEDNENGSACNNDEDMRTQDDSYLATFESKTIINSRHPNPAVTDCYNGGVELRNPSEIPISRLQSGVSNVSFKDVPLDLSEVVSVSTGGRKDSLRDDQNDNNLMDESSSSRSSSRNSIHNVSSEANFNSQQNNDCDRGRAVDLTLRPPSDSENDVEKEASAVENTDLKIRYLLWQQQQSLDKNKFSESSTSTSDSSSAQKIRLLQQCAQQQLTGIGPTSRADMSTISEYVETMRELLGFYGLPKNTVTKLPTPSSGKFIRISSRYSSLCSQSLK
jgi:hypothetical protein